MGIQQQLDNEALSYFPEIEHAISTAKLFESNQMRIKALRMINEFTVPVSEQDAIAIRESSNAIAGNFKYHGWI